MAASPHDAASDIDSDAAPRCPICLDPFRDRAVLSVCFRTAGERACARVCVRVPGADGGHIDGTHVCGATRR